MDRATVLLISVGPGAGERDPSLAPLGATAIGPATYVSLRFFITARMEPCSVTSTPSLRTRGCCTPDLHVSDAAGAPNPWERSWAL